MKPKARSRSLSSHRTFESLSPVNHDVVECISIRDSDSPNSQSPSRRSPPPTTNMSSTSNRRYAIASRSSSRSYSPIPHRHQHHLHHQRRRPPSPPLPAPSPAPPIHLRTSRSSSRELSFTSSRFDKKTERNFCIAVYGLNVYTTKHKIHDIFSKFGQIDSIQLPIDSNSERSCGYCYIFFSLMSDAKAAKEACDGLDIDKRRIRVDYPSPSPTSSRTSRRDIAPRYNSREREYVSRSSSTYHHRPRSPPRRDRYSVKSRSSSRSPSPKNRRMRSRTRSRSSSSIRMRLNREKPPESHCIGVFGLSVFTTQQQIRDTFSKFGPIQRIQVVIDAQTGRSRGFCFIYYHNLEDAKIAKQECSGMEIDSRRIRVDYSITERPHSPTPGVYMGRPTRNNREHEMNVARYRSDYRERRVPAYYPHVESRRRSEYRRYDERRSFTPE